MSERIETKLRAFFGLKTLPFLKPATPEEYLQTSSLTAGLDKLRYLVDRRGIGLLTGAPGMGKSTLLRAFMSGLSKNTHCLSYVAHSTCCATDLLRLIASGFDIMPTHRRADLTLLLAGHQQIESTLRLAVHEAFAQRIALRLRLTGWNREEVDHYILYRLEAAGRTAKLFLPDAVEAIFKASRGVPRLVDRLAEHSLLLALHKHEKDIDAELVTQALDEVEL